MYTYDRHHTALAIVHIALTIILAAGGATPEALCAGAAAIVYADAARLLAYPKRWVSAIVGWPRRRGNAEQ
jgi:hypothetical protein